MPGVWRTGANVLGVSHGVAGQKLHIQLYTRAFQRRTNSGLAVSLCACHGACGPGGHTAEPRAELASHGAHEHDTRLERRDTRRERQHGHTQRRSLGRRCAALVRDCVASAARRLCVHTLTSCCARCYPSRALERIESKRRVSLELLHMHTKNCSDPGCIVLWPMGAPPPQQHPLRCDAALPGPLPSVPGAAAAMPTLIPNDSLETSKTPCWIFS